MAAMTAARHPY